MRFPCLALLALACSELNAQEPTLPGGYDNGTNLNVLYRNEASGKIFATTRGFGISFRQAKHVTQKTRSYYDIDLQNLRHPKETKIMGEGTQRRRYVYGKLNGVLLLRCAIGMQNVLFSKGDHKAVEVRYSYSLGPTIAFAKPYYVRIYHNRPGGGLNKEEHIRFDSENFSPDSGRIQGRSEFSRGLAELKIYPGATAKFNLSFEYAPYTNLIRALETGISVDYFPKALPLMSRNPSENFIITFHLGFVFGRKWF
jgi:hypothetical protein